MGKILRFPSPEDLKFLRKKECDRCDQKLEVRMMSWFTDEALCEECYQEEYQYREELIDHGLDVANFEACGYIPNIPSM